MDIASLLNRDESEDNSRETVVGVDYTPPPPPPKAMTSTPLLSPSRSLRTRPTMAIATLLNRDDSDQSDHETAEPVGNYTPQLAMTVSPPPERAATPPPPPQSSETPTPPSTMTVTPVPPSQAAVSPATALTTTATRPRQSRPRKPSAQSLQAKVDALELVVKHLECVLRDLDKLVSPSSASTGAIREANKPIKITGKTDSQRIRSFLKHTVVLTKEAHQEIAIRTEYLRLLKQYYEGSANVRQLFRGLSLSEWFWMCERWRDITLEYYEPISAERCYQVVQETLQAIETYQLPAATKETGAFGWCDSVHLDANQRHIRFIIHKTLLNADMKQVVDHSWSLYDDGDLYKKAHLGDSCELFHQTLQKISPDTLIIQRVVKYPNLVQLTHSLALVFRVQTETGYMIVIRCIESPRLQGLMKAEGLSLGESFTWDTYDVARRDAQGDCDAILFTATGSVGSDDPTYAKRWRDELLIALVRYEIKMMNTPLISIESSVDEETKENA